MPGNFRRIIGAVVAEHNIGSQAYSYDDQKNYRPNKPAGIVDLLALGVVSVWVRHFIIIFIIFLLNSLLPA